jgi:hypothetical protein
MKLTHEVQDKNETAELDPVHIFMKDADLVKFLHVRWRWDDKMMMINRRIKF